MTTPSPFGPPRGSPPAGPPPPPEAPPPPPAASWPPAGSTVVADEVSRSFSGVVAVSEISIALTPGLTALLGPNGAGKSTMLRMLSGQIRPDAGAVRILGEDPRTNPRVRGRIGLVPQQDGDFGRERALAVVTLSAILSNLDEPESRAARALRRVDLDPDLARGVGTFSKGMRQRVKIAQALVHDPTVLFLDEPLNGLDPRQRRRMTELFAALAEDGRTVLVSSHVLDEVERFGSRVIVIAQGRLAAQGDFRRIRALMDTRPARLRVATSQPARVAALLVASGAAIECRILDQRSFEFGTTDLVTARREILAGAQRIDAHVEEITPLDEDLESVFRYLVGDPR